MSRAKTTVFQLAAEAGVSVENAVASLKTAGVGVTHPRDFVPRGRLAAARAAMGLLRKVPDFRNVSSLALRAGMPEEEARSRLVKAGVLAKRHLKRVAAGQMRQAEDALGLRRTETVVKEQPSTPAPVTIRESKSAKPKPAQKHRGPRPTIIGKEQQIDHLTPEDIENIHWVLVKDLSESKDPIDPPGVRSQDLLESAAHRPLTALGLTDKYPTVAMAGAALLHSIVLNHAFHNGNKRTALVSTLVFADRNGYRVAASEEELYDLLLKVASHGLQEHTKATSQDSDAEVLYIARWLRGRLRALQKQERSRKWNKFRQILTNYGCDSDVIPGNKINIVRGVDGVLLKTQVAYRSEGTEIEINTVKKVRRDLMLDEEHGYPSDIFYRQETKIPSFINKYRTLLRRLAKV